MTATMTIFVGKDARFVVEVASNVGIPCSGGEDDVIVNNGRVNVGMNMEWKHVNGREEALEDLRDLGNDA